MGGSGRMQTGRGGGRMWVEAAKVEEENSDDKGGVIHPALDPRSPRDPEESSSARWPAEVFQQRKTGGPVVRHHASPVTSAPGRSLLFGRHGYPGHPLIEALIDVTHLSGAGSPASQ
ncbi:unnamed protein product [Boreogadus saida]